MTTEDEFQAALDADPTDSQLRQVFADWLDEQNDIRAEGMRMLGMLGKWPFHTAKDRWYWLRHDRDQLTTGAFIANYWMTRMETPTESDNYIQYYSSRRSAEDVACLAWLKFTPTRQAKFRAQAYKPNPKRGVTCKRIMV